MKAKWLLAGLAALGLSKAYLALKLDLFGDEAFYWLEGRYLAWAYSDVPPLTPWLIRAGTELFGDTEWGVRSLAVIAGTAVPWLVYRLARLYVPPARAVAAGALALCLPLVLSLGVLALPDVWINVLCLLLLIQSRKALEGGLRYWGWAGLVAALGLMTHYRFAVPIIALAGYLLATRRGRELLRGPGPWLGGALAGLGAMPSLWFNLEHDFSALGFQLSDRHPWTFQAEGLLQPLGQALVSTPGMFVLLALAAVIVIRRARDDERWALLGWAGLTPWLCYWILAPFADQQRTSFHWPLAAYLPLCVALPDAALAARRWLADRWGRRLAGSLVVAMVGLGALAGVAVMAHLGVASGRAEWRPSSRILFPDNLLGWRQAAGTLAELRARHGAGERLIADNFMLAAELAFEGKDRERVFALNHPLNHKHGRARQLRIWGLDEPGIGEDWHSGWLVIEETATDLVDRPRWLREVCERFPGAALLADRPLYGGRKRFLYYRVERLGGGSCDLPAFAYLDAPVADQRLRGVVEVAGWAFEDQGGVAQVEVLLDGEAVGPATYGLSHPGVQVLFAGSTDPNHPAVGFSFELDTETIADGRHWLSLRTRAADGGVREFDPVPVVVDNGD